VDSLPRHISLGGTQGPESRLRPTLGADRRCAMCMVKKGKLQNELSEHIEQKGLSNFAALQN
jgi:hypothetical protein